MRGFLGAMDKKCLKFLWGFSVRRGCRNISTILIDIFGKNVGRVVGWGSEGKKVTPPK